MLDFDATNDTGNNGARHGSDDGPTRARRDIIVIGASAGGVEATSEIVRALPADLPAAVFIVVHIAPTATSLLPAILARRGALPVRHPNDGDPIEPGTIYVAPPDRHLMIARGRVHVTHGPMENGTRPAVDPLFRSAATAYGARVVGVVLSGNLDDGTAGLMAIKRCGGVAIVQDPADALFPGMPQSAVEHVPVDQIVPLEAIPRAILVASEELVDENAPCRDARFLRREVKMVDWDEHVSTTDGPLPLPRGEPSGFTCPNCHGALWELDDGNLVRYRCRVGHAFSPETLVALDSEDVEEALWVAYRALEESAALARRMEARAIDHEHAYSATRHAQHAAELEHRATILRNLLATTSTLTAAEPGSVVGPA